MSIEIKGDNLKQSLLGLVVALVEIVRDALKIQALKRVEGGTLDPEECERLGQTLMDLDIALEGLKQEQGITETVQSLRDNLDNIVDDLIKNLSEPEQLEKTGTGV
jgi:hypothetical protein